MLCCLLGLAWATTDVVQGQTTLQPAVPGNPPPYVPGMSVPLQPGPAATLDGTIQPVNPAWDPYADPSTQTAPLVPDQGFLYTRPDGTIGQRERLLQQIDFQYTYLDGGDARDELQINDLETRATFAIPLPQYGVAPLLLTPGFGVHLWDAPLALDNPNFYDAYLDIGWRPQITPTLSADLGIRPGIYTEFDFVDSDSFRIKGRALGIYTPSPQFQFVAGILYLHRIPVKLLPAGGVIWTPNDSTRFEFLFPKPKLAQRFNTYGNTEWWWYVAGEYGGDTWTSDLTGVQQRIDYEDIRVLLGLEFHNFSGLRGHFEVGYAFEREVETEASGTFPLDETWLLRAGVTY